MAGAQPNFYLWGAWKARTIKEPFLTKKVAGPLKKIVLGDTFIIGLKEKGQVVSWGKDPNKGCLGLGCPGKGHSESSKTSVDQPEEIKELKNVTDIQMGTDHVVALTQIGEVYCWGSNAKGQLGVSKEPIRWEPTKVEALASEQIMQIAVIKNSTFALSISGAVYAWGDNENNTLGLEETHLKQVDEPKRLSLLGEMRVRKLDIFEGRTIIAHVRAPETDEELVTDSVEDAKETEVEIFKGIDLMRDAMEKTQEWWNHLLSIKHGQPYDMPHDSPDLKTARDGNASGLEEDLQVEPEKLHRAERHLDALLNAAVYELKRTQQQPGTRNVKFIICMFIDECRLRREKVQRTISARQLSDAKRKVHDINAYSVTDFGANANEEIRKIIAVNKDLQQVLDIVNHVPTVDAMSEELKLTLIECLECKLQLHDTRVELLKAADSKPSDPMLPALRIIKGRWNTLKHFSLYALYLECENKKMEFKDDDDHLRYLVNASNEQIDQMLQVDRDRIISHDTLVPALCYDLLRENAELRKMTNAYQLHVLMLHKEKKLTEQSGLQNVSGSMAERDTPAALTG
jgi:hypothetical protein